MAHATNPEAVKSAIELGAHSVEHSYIMDEESIQGLLESKAWYVPTLSITHLTPDQATSEEEHQWVKRKGMAPDLIRRANDASRTHKTWFQSALNAGVKMAVGSDIVPLPESVLLEMGLWVKDGATPWQTLLAATRNAAELCGVGKDLGTVESGKLADLIVVKENPLEDVNNLRGLLLVIKEGQVVSNKR